MARKQVRHWQRPDLRAWAHSCRAWTIEGYCDLGVQTFVDPWPLSVAGEALAVLTGRRLLELVRDGGRWAIDSRDPEDSIARLEGRRDTGAIVLARHECGRPLPSSSAYGPAYVFELLAPPLKITSDPEGPPF